MNEERLRELEWAAQHAIVHKPRKGCRCAGRCPECKWDREQRKKLTPQAMIEVIHEVRRLQGQVAGHSGPPKPV